MKNEHRTTGVLCAHRRTVQQSVTMTGNSLEKKKQAQMTGDEALRMGWKRKEGSDCE